MSKGAIELEGEMLVSWRFFENVLLEKFQVQLPPIRKKLDALRLIRLLHWCWKYKVTYPWVVETLVTYWRAFSASIPKGKRKRPPVLGASISTFCGRRSEQVIQEAVKKWFPNGENVDLWRNNARNIEWETERDRGIVREDWSDLEKLAKKYAARMRRERQLRGKFAQQMKRRKRRDNPWL